MNEIIEKFRKKTIRNTKIEIYLLQFYSYLIKYLDHVDFLTRNNWNKTNFKEKIVYVSAGMLSNEDISWEDAKNFFGFVDFDETNFDEHKLLELINFCLGLVNEIRITDNAYPYTNQYWDFNALRKFCPENYKLLILEFFKISESFLLVYDETKQMLLPTEQKELLEKINNPTFSDMAYLYKGSKIFLEKENNFSAIAKKMLFIFNKNNNKYRDLLKVYFNEEKLNDLSRECNGYFRHSENDSGDKEKTLEWKSFDENKKIKVMNESFSVYLFILSLLRDNDLIDEFISSLNNN